jgi:hypothetical protein
MLEPPLLFDNDVFGNTVARYFSHNDKVYGLSADGFKNLRRLADQVVKTRWVVESLGREFVEDRIFIWCKENFQVEPPQPFTQYLLAKATAEVQRIPIWYPSLFWRCKRNSNSDLHG